MSFPGFVRLQGPELLGVRTPDDYLRWHERHVVERGGQTWDSPEGVVASVNWGRWVAPCFWCDLHGRGSTMLTRPDWRLACCVECGAIYRDVAFPESADAIEAVLCRRPIRDVQNWIPGETVADLRRENAEHGVEV